MATSAETAVLDMIASEAECESTLWAEALLSRHERQLVPVFSPLGPPEHALAVETIYEGYLVHYGRSRLFSPPDGDVALLLGDYLYAHGLVRVAAAGDVAAVHDLADLISLCAQARADGRDGDGAAWAATAALLGQGRLGEASRALRDHGDHARLLALARAAASPGDIERALSAHASLIGKDGKPLE